MVQRIFRQIKSVDPSAEITVATSKTQVSALNNQLGENINISVEPCRRDTFPAIALATAYLHGVMKIPENESVVVFPVDPYVDENYFIALKKLSELADNSESNLNLMGIEPTYPSEKYGYIIPENNEFVSKVIEFKEKPDAKTAEKYISKGALWNGGVFAYKLKYVLEKAEEYLGTSDYKKLFENYANLPKISFDYAVVEKEKNINVMRFSGQWKDLGTWNTLTESMEENIIGNGIMNDNCENVHIVNELNVPILAMGLKNVVISASPEGIVVSDKTDSSYIKPFVDEIDQQIMFAEKSWGNYQVINVEKESLTIKITLRPGQKMSYHSHQHRDEIWTVISGEGEIIINDKKRNICSGDVIEISKGDKHTVSAKTKLRIIEVQLGEEISVTDKIKFE